MKTLNYISSTLMAKIFNVSESMIKNWRHGRTKIPPDVKKDSNRIEKLLLKIQTKYSDNRK